MDDIIAEFLAETNESLTELDNSILTLEQNPNDPALISKIFRIIHTIKGTCGFLGLPRLERLAHKAEDVLGLFRDGKLDVKPEYVSLILQTLDRIKEITAGLEETGQEPNGDDGEIIATLEAVAAGHLGETISNDHHDDIPAMAAPEPVAMEPEVVDDPVVDDVAMADVPPPQQSTQQPAQQAAPQSAPQGQGGESQSLRVNVDVLEDLMTMVSELVLTRNQLLQITRQNKDSEFVAPLQRLNLVVSDLQEGVMKTRMQPVGNAWAKLPRIVRDVCNELGKKIDLEMYGQDTELDRQVLEMIKDPMTHMIRNSADHGVELPADRIAAGKPETGKIILRSYHQGGHIMIEVSDDGRGLSAEKIKKKIRENGLATEEQLEAMSTQQIQQYIFHAGFSTADKITAVSGRGVGMDVVRSNIEKIGGSIEMRSVEGKGTHFTIKIPLTLAIVSALIIGIGNERFAIPQLSVSELVLITKDGPNRIEYVDNAQVLRLRGNLLPLIDLRELIQYTPQEGSGEQEPDSKFVVVTRVAQFMFGVIVDKVYDLEEIVVKPVTRLLKNLHIFSGNTILGDGQVIMILDPAGILKVCNVSDIMENLQSAQATEAAAEIAAQGEENILLLFRAGAGAVKAAPLQMISRLEKIDVTRIDESGGRAVIQYLGHLMPVMTLSGMVPPSGEYPLIILQDQGRNIGLLVDEIIDISKYYGTLDHSDDPSMMGSAIIDARTTDIINPAWYCNGGIVIESRTDTKREAAA